MNKRFSFIQEWMKPKHSFRLINRSSVRLLISMITKVGNNFGTWGLNGFGEKIQ